MGVKTIDLVHHIMDGYGRIIETELKENNKIFDEALNTTTLIDKYFEIIDYCIQYSDYGKHPYTSDQIINNSYNTVLATFLYTEHSKMWHKKLLSEKKWPEFKKFSAG